MRFSFFSPPRPLLLRDQDMTDWTGKDVSVKDMASLSLPFSGTPLSLLLDTSAIHSTYDTLPRMGFWDRRMLLSNRLEKQDSLGDMKGLVSYSKTHVGYIRASLDPWKEILEKQNLPIASIKIVPLELIIRLFPSKEPSWTLVLYENKEGLVRHLLVHQGHLIFMRQVISAGPFETEVAASLRYTERFLHAQTLEKILIFGHLKGTFSDLILGIPVERKAPTIPFEEAFLQLYLSSGRFLIQPSTPTLTPNPFKKTFRRLLWPLWMTKGLILYGVVVLFLGFGLGLSSYSIHRKKISLQKETFMLENQRRYYEKHDSDLLKKADLLHFYEKIRHQEADFLPLLEKIGTLKSQKMILTQIQWEKGKESSSPQLTFKVDLFLGALSPLQGQEVLKNFTLSLRNAFPSFRVETLENQSPKAILLYPAQESPAAMHPLSETYRLEKG